MNHFFWPHRTNDTQDNDEPDSSSSSPERRQQRQDVGMNAPKAPLLCSDQHGGHGYHSPNTDRSIPATTLNVSKEPPSNEYVLVGPSQCRKQSLSSFASDLFSHSRPCFSLVSLECRLLFILGLYDGSIFLCCHCPITINDGGLRWYVL